MKIDQVKYIVEPILKKHQIKKAGIFGSIAREMNNAFSDLDLLVEHNGEISLLDFVRLKNELEDELGMKVDLVEYQTLKPRLKKQILAEEIKIYG